MLSYLRRTIPVIARASLGRDGRLISQLERRVQLTQLDLNWHMNQAAYAQVMELGRTDWVIRSGAWARWQAQGIKPVVADQRIVYRRELRLGTRYRVDSRAVGMEGRLFHVRSLLLVGDRVHALGELHMIFIGPEGVLGAEDAAAACEGLAVEPLAIQDWRVVAG